MIPLAILRPPLDMTCLSRNKDKIVAGKATVMYRAAPISFA